MKLGIDIGNSKVKGAMLSDKNVVTSMIDFPSAITHISDEKYLTYPNGDDFYIQVMDSALEHFDGIVAVGHKAIDLPGYHEFDVSSTSYKTNHAMTTSMLFGAIAQTMKKAKTIDLKVAVSIPIVESKTIGLVKEYKQRLEGTHTLRVFKNDKVQNVTVTISQAIVTNEGQAGFFGLLDTVDTPFQNAMSTVYRLLDEDTNPVSDFNDFLVCDIGEGTSDISVFRNKRFNSDYSFSVTEGIGNLLETAMENAKREKLTIESRKDLQKVVESTNKRQANRRKKWMEYVTPTENAFIDTLVDTIIKAYGNRDYYDAIIFFGGGFSALTGYTVSDGDLFIRNARLFDILNERLADLNKDAGLIFGVPAPYAETINVRGLTQILTSIE